MEDLVDPVLIEDMDLAMDILDEKIVVTIADAEDLAAMMTMNLVVADLVSPAEKKDLVDHAMVEETQTVIETMDLQAPLDDQDHLGLEVVDPIVAHFDISDHGVVQDSTTR